METLVAMGVPVEQAQGYLEMAGGNAEMAINLWLQMSGMDGGGGMGGRSSGSDPKSKLGWDVPDWYSLVWPEVANIPDSWIKQGMAFDQKVPIGIVQPKNGPCGVLAAVQAVLISQCRKKENFSEKYKPTLVDLTEAITAMLSQGSKNGSPIRICTWAGKIGQEVKVTEAKSVEEARKAVGENIKLFQAEGGCVLLVYSAALTRGVDKIKKDIVSEGGEGPLTISAHGHWLCTSELVSLLIRGKAGGNVGAYSQLGGAPHDWNMKLEVGLLTADEGKQGMIVCDSLKTPSAPVWLLHGGDHFTTLWSNADLKEGKGTHTLYHWNGLPPGGPRLSEIKAVAKYGEAPKAPKKRVDTYKKPQPGEIESVVQAHPEDKKKRPDMYDTWRYEVMLAVEDKSVKGPERPKDLPPEPKFKQGSITPGPWRCRTCYANRFKTMYFKLNPAGATKCEGPCGKSREEAGWSIWLDFKELPRSQQSVIHQREAPKIKKILWTKWPGAEITYNDDTDFGGTPPSA
ncbi:hypothetical protein AAMO2058_000006300 [Amorphochlora amoebiformis]